MNEKINRQIDKLARDILILSRNTLLVNLRFLDLALNRLNFEISDVSLATDGKSIFYNPSEVLNRYKQEKEIPVRDYLHIVMHCIFRHMFTASFVDRPCWDLACDIAAEYSIYQLGLKSAAAKREERQIEIYAKLEKNLKIISAPEVYNYYLSMNMSSAELERLRAVFCADDHSLWYERFIITESGEKRKPENIKKASKNKTDVTEQLTEADSSLSENEGSGKEKADFENSADGEAQKAENNSESEESSISLKQLSEREELSEIWKNISEFIQTDLETFSKEHGEKAGNLVESLNKLNREKYDYSEFLKKFAVMGETMKINDEEFDYIFYTYGLKLFEKMPLIEPLEYKEVKAIKEFIIAVDTSGSTYEGLVQKFITKTYNILKSTESFFTKVNIHIIQCDTTIQEDKKITCQKDFDEYIKTMKIQGGGGTDFRPVFEYIEKLRKNGEFFNLKGLIYFTDGRGDFPKTKPDYKTAFVYIDNDYNNFDVPPWAVKLILDKNEI